MNSFQQMKVKLWKQRMQAPKKIRMKLRTPKENQKTIKMGPRTPDQKMIKMDQRK